MVNDLAAQSHQEHYPGEVIRADQLDDNRFLFNCQNGVRLLLQVLSDKILRFRYLTDGPLSPDFSYAVPADALSRQAPVLVEFREKPDHYRITTERLICIVQKESLKTRV
ncbi:MAG: glycosyl hydrolase, partial [Hymenobacter sp.]|nr:glycosyl hydrolase [Hymenobacter sp.]